MLGELIEVLQQYRDLHGDIPIYLNIEELDEDNFYELTSVDVAITNDDEKLIRLNSRVSEI